MSSGWMMIADMLASVHTCCDVPAGAVFGPCDPQHTPLGNSIVFIALRCLDKHATAYVHQVDTSVPSISVEGPLWLRLVRSARNADEQNLEAYVKDGRLFYRALKDISKRTELLVWYEKDLAELLSLAGTQKNNNGYRCLYCKQRFLFEFPVLAHQRFLCTERPTRFSSKSTLFKPCMDFHNLARNSGSGNLARRRHSLYSGEESPLHARTPYKRIFTTLLKRKFSSASSSQSGSSEISMTNEGGHSLHWVTGSHDNRKAELEALDSKVSKNPIMHHARGSQLATTATTDKDQTSAFVPPRSITDQAIRVRFIPGVTPMRDTTTFPCSITQAAAAAKATKSLALALFKQPALVYESGLWSKHPNPLRTQNSPEWSLLPATLSVLGLPAKNWCAKCRISFHMTSDLVQHMRFHHKRSAEQIRQHSEEKLRCSICDESFRERHHLSRHMGSHTESALASPE
ncbi:hypothetical protein NFI96_017840 [Prochilodus magdalenae]|nr:hypothetical protein NFI96_017840 [Prochilodus magdalenae]